MESADHDKLNFNLYPVKLEENEDLEYCNKNNINSFVNVKDEIFEVTETVIEQELSHNNDLDDGISSAHLVNKQKKSEFNVKEESQSFRSVLFKFKCSSCVIECVDEESYNNHIMCHTNTEDFRKCNEQSYCMLPVKSEDELVNEVAQPAQSIWIDVPAASSLTTSNEDAYKKIGIRLIENSAKSINDNVDDKIGKKYDDRHETTDIVAFECSSCSKQFHSQLDLQEHMSDHNKINVVPSLICPQCNVLCDSKEISFSQKFYVTQHLGTHTEKKLSNYKAFSQNTVSNKDLTTLSEKDSVKCLVCHKSFSQFNNLKIPLESHTRDKPLQCGVCHKSMSHSGALKRHLSIHTGEKPFDCEVCHKSFPLNHELKRHLRSHTGERPFICEVCHKSFPLNSVLKEHLRIHSGEKPFSCKVCHKSFSRNCILKSHLRTHTGEKLFKCGACHKLFSYRSDLKRHLKTHTGEKPFNCAVCHKAFLRNYELKQHLKTHSGDKPFDCAVCNKSFSRKYDLNMHLRTHTQEKPYNCEMCHKSFSHSSYLKRHLRIHE